MTTILSEGVIVPDVGDVNWAGKLEVNWNLLNGALANLSGNVKLDRDNIWTGEQSFTLPIVGSITGTASKAIADEDGTSIKTGYVNVAGNQTVTGNKEFTGSNTFNNILPNATNTYALGSSSYQWSSVYADSYYYGTTAFTDKFVTADTIQTINASKTINSNFPYLYIKNPNKEKGVAPSDRQWGRLNFTDKNNATIAGMEHSIYSNGASQLAISINNLYSNGTLNPSGTSESCAITLELSSSGGKSIVSGANASTDLGTSTNKWKTLNGVNPGALSLPDTSNSVAVDTTDWVYDGLTANLIKFNNAVQTFSGWLYITAQNTSANDRIVVRYIGSDAGNLTFIGGKFDGASSIFVACPIVAGVSTYVWSTKALNTIKIYKALGNV